MGMAGAKLLLCVAGPTASIRSAFFLRHFLFFDPTKLSEATPAALLDAAANGHIGLDRRLIRAIVDRPEESIPAVIEFSKRDRSLDAVDLAPELLALFRHWKTEGGVPFLIEYIKADPNDVADEAIETLVAIGEPALEALLRLYEELDESDGGEVAFVLANLKIRDERVRKLLEDRLEFDLADAAFLLSLHGDPEAIPALEKQLEQLADEDSELKNELEQAISTLKSATDPHAPPAAEPDTFDIYSIYPEEADLPMELLDEDQRTELLSHPVAAIRQAAANSFFNRELTAEVQAKLLEIAQKDESPEVRARAWESLTDATEKTEVVEAMLAALRRLDLPVEERGGLLVGLAPEADRNEVRQAIGEFYQLPEGRAKALEAMWRSVHPSFRDYFARHLEDGDLEVRRGAVWGVGYFGLKGELGRVRNLFEDEELRSDALFAYALAVPGELSRGRMKSLYSRIEKEARGLSEMEEHLVKAALDERLVMAGKEAYFAPQED